MTRSARRALGAGVVTSIGSLPHTSPALAAEAVLALHPQLPALPELPSVHPSEGITDRWLGMSIEHGEFDPEAHGGFLAFLDAAAIAAPSAVKAQVAGPLTMGMALRARGVSPTEAFERGAEISAAAAHAVVAQLDRRLPSADRVVFLDEPALVAWVDGDAPLDREGAVDLLSGVLAQVDAVTGVHVCGAGDRRMAIEAGPDIVGFEVRPSIVDDGVAVARYLDAGGWIAWGAVPTDRPVGDHADHWWNALVALWCDLTRGGCDPAVLRTQALITPACGLAAHSVDQAESILRLCVEIGERVREQAIATRLSVGA
ncbi:MAG TPA: hypothetical protein VI916_05635 [Acidimicrobiia bacterium]|nr:hypothetical protein [Acidimicrobiia bacterium]